ncbi:DUF883 domain-containing protein [Cronobacter universalis]|uniref:Bacterial protein of uncharacterized function (DUF883) n=1 Tax=Cronobacter universalis NCTC 9529 TaxID=1074000 RepID=A0AAC8VS46_9ENTR|nr:DUF883 domain-containing protein [Cronobacter universalis]ALB55938.1 hypothetical protein AFK65_15180 [Cronobacter universalis NCTC 9529]ELY6247516.1 DUF883 domain-containing protein [Cronobacter universalis]ELY7390625.1 DUF883 domain-containing protein [Cronobacter universalis]MDI7660185.1 DUF883 domain-containing protein [Cronobacter universalis]CCK15725.1 FIG00554257: hypothetical protein [Cronobacter universalis NCTC 9529]
MFNRNTRSDVNAGVDDINQDISRLADTLEGVLKSWGSDAKGEADVARRKAESLLRETRARMHGRSQVSQAARDAVSCASTFVRERPLSSLGIGAAVGIFLGALLITRR